MSSFRAGVRVSALILTLAASAWVSPESWADGSGSGSATSSDSSAQTQSPPRTAKPERVDVDTIRRKYWERGDESDARVIQNRMYSKAGKFELGAYYASISTDPFLTVRAAVASLGFHFTESWGLNFIYWKDYVSASSAQATLQADAHTTANTNPPNDFKGLEVAYSPVYGKISLFGTMIIHYDLHLLAGYGINDTQSGNDGTISIGIGQQFYLNRFLSLRLDYRALNFTEVVPSAPGGPPPISRNNWTDVVTLGITAFFGFF